VSDLLDRRAQKKARTRGHIRAVAQRLFTERGFDSVTIADVAHEADVAVQTVFNHFATKEELFFDGHTPWVEGPAAAVRSRAPEVPPLSALRGYLVGAVRDIIASHAAPERRCHISTLQASETLCAQERELVHEAELRLQAALLEAWKPGTDAVPADPEATAPLVAAIWLAAARSLIVEQRARLTTGADPCRIATAAADLVERLFGELEAAVDLVPSPAGTIPPAVDTGRPQDRIYRAG
jgi:AcrR family transcriptional regulator